MIETLIQSVQDLATKAIDMVESGFDFRLPELPSASSEKDALVQEVLTLRAQLSARDATDFFGLPGTPVIEGDTICVHLGDLNVSFDDALEYSLDEFKDLDCTSLEDMSKIWAHECGHRVLQPLPLSDWAHELGADFFAGVRSEMLGLPSGHFEEALRNQPPSESHPGGDLRMRAIDFGRIFVAEMRNRGMEPTLEQCIAAFQLSPFASMDYSDMEQGGLAEAQGVLETGQENALGAEAAFTPSPNPYATEGTFSQYWNLPPVDEMDFFTLPTLTEADYKAIEQQILQDSIPWQQEKLDPVSPPPTSPIFDYDDKGGCTVTDITGQRIHYTNAQEVYDMCDVFSGFHANEHSWDGAIAYNQSRLDRAAEIEAKRDDAVNKYHNALGAGDINGAAYWEKEANGWQGVLGDHWGVSTYGLPPKAPGI